MQAFNRISTSLLREDTGVGAPQHTSDVASDVAKRLGVSTRTIQRYFEDEPIYGNVPNAGLPKGFLYASAQNVH